MSNITLVNEKNETISEFFKYQGLNFKYVKDLSGVWKKESNENKESFVIFYNKYPYKQYLKRDVKESLSIKIYGEEYSLKEISRDSDDRDNVLNVYNVLMKEKKILEQIFINKYPQNYGGILNSVETSQRISSRRNPSILNNGGSSQKGGFLEAETVYGNILKIINSNNASKELKRSSFFFLGSTSNQHTFTNNMKKTITKETYCSITCQYFYFVKINFSSKYLQTYIEIPYIVRIDRNIYDYMYSVIKKVLEQIPNNIFDNKNETIANFEESAKEKFFSPNFKK